MSARCPECEAPVDTVDDLIDHYRANHPGQGTHQPLAIEEFRRRVDEWSSRDDVEAAAVMVRYVWDRARTRLELGPVEGSSSRR